jgi:hypothetical protein
MPGQLSLNLCASIHDLGDAGLAIIDLEGSPGGPLEVTLVVPGASAGSNQKGLRLRICRIPEVSGRAGKLGLGAGDS